MLSDTLNRPVKDLRISVTDRCNFRCTYCMPFEQYDEWIDRRELLTYEEIVRVAAIFLELGAEKIRLTGGEPLVRKDLDHLVAKLSRLDRLRDLSLTTNGALLTEQAQRLRAAGLNRINVSLDSLDPDRFKKITQRGSLAAVLEGLEAARRAGFQRIKINAVIERGVNDDEILPLVDFGRANGFAVRFIEFMDVGTLNRWDRAHVFSAREIRDRIHAAFPLEPLAASYRGEVAHRYRYADGAGEIGIIGSVTQPFCGDCTRARLSADGHLFTCLFATAGIDLKTPLRSGVGDEALAALLAGVWRARGDRYSEERAESAARREKIEMFRIGG